MPLKTCLASEEQKRCRKYLKSIQKLSRRAEEEPVFINLVKIQSKAFLSFLGAPNTSKLLQEQVVNIVIDIWPIKLYRIRRCIKKYEKN